MISQAEYLEILSTSLGPAILGFVAGLVRMAQHGWKGLSHFIAEMSTCVFVAVITGFLLDLSDFPPTVIAGITAASGFGGVKLLEAILWRADKEIRTARLPGIRPASSSEEVE